jgi:hypothetical protein
MSQEIGALSLQSGFVIAAIIAAVLVANRIGGDGALALRVTQVAIGLALVLLIFSATAAFRGPPSAPSQDLFGAEVESGDELRAAQEEFAAFAEESAERNSEVGTVHVGLGIIFVAAGVALFRRLRAIPPGFLLGGVLLLLLGAPAGGGLTDLLSGLGAFYGTVFGGSAAEAGMTRDVARFVVLFAGTLVLLWAAFWRWEFLPSESEPPAAPPAPQPPEPAGGPAPGAAGTP